MTPKFEPGDAVRLIKDLRYECLDYGDVGDVGVVLEVETTRDSTYHYRAWLFVKKEPVWYAADELEKLDD